MCSHRNHKRFKDHDFDVEILEKSVDYDYIMKQEEFYIKKYDSYYNGLNESINGKGNHLSNNFTTKGYKFSKESRLLMSKKAKERIERDGIPFKGKQHTEKSKLLMSKAKKGKQPWTKLKCNDVIELINLYYDHEYIDNVGNIMKNGRKMSYLRAFALKYSKIYNITPQNIIKIIKGETWKNVERKYKI